jgi:integrative and conjugative element protein (TIGR02256 family)
MLWRCPAPAGALLLVESEVLERLEPFRQSDAEAPEAGGILIGYRRGPHLHVVDATTPGREDCRSRYEFHRLDPSHQHAAHMRWTRSRHTLDYVGEWHTHPQIDPAPSSLDLDEWALILSRRNVAMIFAILGLDDWWVGIGHRRLIDRALPVADC